MPDWRTRRSLRNAERAAFEQRLAREILTTERFRRRRLNSNGFARPHWHKYQWDTMHFRLMVAAVFRFAVRKG